MHARDDLRAGLDADRRRYRDRRRHLARHPCADRASRAVGPPKRQDSASDDGGIAWEEVFVGGGVATIGAAISAGLAIAALVRRVAPAGCVDLGPRLGLPKLPGGEVMLYSSLTDPRARGAMRTLGAAFRAGAG